jgi:anhydro-N-acetylmuramic acid kinase
LSLSSKYTVLGVMSGTSLDGLDLALCSFEKKGTSVEYVIQKAQTIAYSENQKLKLKEASQITTESYLKLHHVFGKYIAKEINLFLKDVPNKPEAISSHGHTIFHQPQQGFTSQIGCGATIAANTGVTTVCDLRSMDVALAGQGAPLVPIGDELLFGNYECCLNLGGIANISFYSGEKRRAFDICVVNMALNYFAKLEGKEYDQNGEMAKSGTCDELLLQTLNQLDFYKTTGPKSLGREWFESHFLPYVKMSNLSTADTLATLVHHSALQLSQTLNENSIKQVFVTGGGAHNSFLMDTFRSYYKGEVIVPDALTVNFKEALIFAFLGYLRLTERINTLSSVTGAKRDSVGGAVYLGK